MAYEFIRIGDKILINIPDENWLWGYRPVEKQHGTPAEVIGFGEITYGRIHNFGMKPGIYANRWWTKLRLEDGKEYTEFSSRLELADKNEIEKRLAELKSGRRLEDKEFLRELPETKFWEGDNVLVCKADRVVTVSLPDVSLGDAKAISKGEKPNNLLMIVDIEWDRKKEGEPWKYKVSDNFRAGWCAYAYEPDIELMERGNVWKFYHGEKLKFNDVNEEANFFNMLGQTEEVVNPANNLYAWTKDEVLQAIKEGVADGFSLSGKLFGFGEKKINAVRFKDRDLGARVRESTLAGFGAG